jgi:Protein of unknown function (DUF3089)
MQRVMTARSTRKVGWRTWLVAALGAAALIVPGLTAASASAETTWLCKPGLTNNPCLSSEEATIDTGTGFKFVEHAKPASNPPVDCFYVYPTVSSQLGPNANLNIDPEETQIAIGQASRFSQVCKVYAPIYPQITILGLLKGEATPKTVATAYIGVATAFDEYLARFNNGRGIVLIGHSQGAAMLTRLIREQIDPNPARRKQLVSAVLLGGNITVPTGKTVGGSFQNVPTCGSVLQTACVVAYSSFEKTPPANSLFGRSEAGITALGGSPAGPGFEVVCVNPAQFAQDEGESGPLFGYASTTPFPGLLKPFVQVPKAPTPWVGNPAQYSGQCKRAEGAHWLQVTPSGPPGDTREPLLETLGPEWGTHLADVNLALGNLVGTVAIQSGAYLFGH